MTTRDVDDLWRGTSDTSSAVRARSRSSPAERLAWLEETLLLAEASGALGLDRARRQASADTWAREAGLIRRDRAESSP
ncbi:hypothetical protein ACQE98_11680 [Ornithinimicrobium sp. W1679]|uniref:hypothetical protein n=1 Tax=unclassified Ornithinimicrobium TaxID=2615080 RepID=UPI003CE6B06C